jgi:hypothetical protein
MSKKDSAIYGLACMILLMLVSLALVYTSWGPPLCFLLSLVFSFVIIWVWISWIIWTLSSSDIS